LVGEGPLRTALQQRIRVLGLEQEVLLVGQVPYGSIHQYYAASHVFLFSSLHDTSGNVILEAMAHALPVVTLDHHGASEIVSAETGIKVPIRDRTQVIEGLASALERLVIDAELCRMMGESARERVARVYDWDHKGELLRLLYARVSAPFRAVQATSSDLASGPSSPRASRADPPGA
jgi:glycosyltransferase involved in cell wall biosynthesis